VTTLTPDNFNSIVGGDKHVIVEFYAPWCIHCKRLTPVYELVGHAFHKHHKVVIAKLDAIAYPAIKEHFEVDSFPMLKFFPANQKILDPIDFKGSRTAPGIVDFVNEHAGTKTKLKGPAASAGKIPTLTPEAKERAKQRWKAQQGGGMGANMGANMASQAKPADAFVPPPVVTKKDKKMDDRISGIPEGQGEIDEAQRAKLEARRLELQQKLAVEEAQKAAKEAEALKKSQAEAAAKAEEPKEVPEEAAAEAEAQQESKKAEEAEAKKKAAEADAQKKAAEAEAQKKAAEAKKAEKKTPASGVDKAKAKVASGMDSARAKLEARKKAKAAKRDEL